MNFDLLPSEKALGQFIKNPKLSAKEKEILQRIKKHLYINLSKKNAVLVEMDGEAYRLCKDLIAKVHEKRNPKS